MATLFKCLAFFYVFKQYKTRHSGTYRQLDGSCHLNSAGASYTDNGSPLYFMPGYNPYAPTTFLGVDGQHPHFSSSEGMPCYPWNSVFTGDAEYQNPTSWGTKSAMASNGPKRSSDLNLNRSTTTFNERSPNYPFNMQSRQSTSNISQSFLQSQLLCSLNKSTLQSGAAYHVAKGYEPCLNLSSFAYQNQGLFGNYSMMNGPKVRENSYVNGESEEVTCGPRAYIDHEECGHSFKSDEYNLDGFQTKYEYAKFYIIKSYSEDDVHKCVKYDVWSSTPNGNKKLDAAFREAEEKTRETGCRCPVFLFFSVNGSGQFVGVAEMMGSVEFEKKMDFWQLDKWSGFFPVKWHIIKDIPNTQLRHIILENNDNRPVTYTRDTQEVGLEQGLEMLEIMKRYLSKTSLLDDLSFYENREKLLKARRTSKVEKEEGSMDAAASSLINLTRNLSLNNNDIR
ncbi:uncharacterized protein LOC112500081 isoform X2 [Cynara cardunculus var. scolymus]|uniref:uncharacterized protein LOC112500081 isoform X2 n=1 Tax=Cynara cardunculus var. scolymus TaxID=59895 RepID=UPI000D6275B5|nr:uncharacterized protein LOC112500081 isoform X2 [Cynara cardunculus var. scolymus]